MVVTHTFCKCLNCGTTAEILDEDWLKHPTEIVCQDCGYENSLFDQRLEIEEIQF